MRIIRRGYIEIAALLAFVASILGGALRARDQAEDAIRNSDVVALVALPPHFQGNGSVTSIIQKPVNALLWALLGAIVIAALIHLALRFKARFAGPVPALTLMGLIAASIWPWMIDRSVIAGVIIAAIAPVGIVGGLLAEKRRNGLSFDDLPMAAIAGWLIMGSFGALALLLHKHLGWPPEMAQLCALLAATLAIVWTQLRLDDNISCALVAIWAFIGIAAASFDGSMTVATACVLGIAAMAVVLVRVTT